MMISPPPIEIAAHTHTLTQMADYEMFKTMMSQLQWMFGGMGAIIVALGIAMWRSLLNRIGSSRREDKENCKRCRTDHDTHKGEFRTAIVRELDAMWENVNACCKSTGVTPLSKKDVRAISGLEG